MPGVGRRVNARAPHDLRQPAALARVAAGTRNPAMFAPLLLAAALVVSPPPPRPEISGRVLADVCLPFVAGQGVAPESLDFLGFTGPATGALRDLQTEDGAYLLRLTESDGEVSGDARRGCVLQARRAAFDVVVAAARTPLQRAGFTPSPGEPADWPVWTHGGASVSIHQSEGRATIVRVAYSSLDAGAD